MTANNHPLVSVIIACYNAERYISDCLETIINQTYNNIEILVCDDNSSDNSYEILKKYSQIDDRIIVLKNDSNLFAAETRNRCINQSNGEYLLIQDIDDKSEESRIEILLNQILNEEIDFVSSDMIPFSDEGIDEVKTIVRKPEYPDKNDFLWGLPFYHAATLFKRECVLSVDGYRIAKETRRGQDYDLFMRLYAAGFKGKNIYEKLYWYRINTDTIKRRNFSARVDECVLRYKGFRKLGLLPKGVPYLFKPIFAYFYKLIRYRKFLNH